ncbi:MAG: hypothetical protein ABIB97_02835 [Patescibacteria group bacterium]
MNKNKLTAATVIIIGLALIVWYLASQYSPLFDDEDADQTAENVKITSVDEICDGDEDCPKQYSCYAPASCDFIEGRTVCDRPEGDPICYFNCVTDADCGQEETCQEVDQLINNRLIDKKLCL